MWQTWSEEWQRRKSNLVRSLFEDIPILSPILETKEPKSVVSSAASSRSNSPLPELIIEKERSHHDEPEDFYKTLEKKMLKLYRKLFYDIDYVSDVNDFGNEDGVINDEYNKQPDDENYIDDDHDCILLFDSENQLSLKDKNNSNALNDCTEISDNRTTSRNVSDASSSASDDVEMEFETFDGQQSAMSYETDSSEHPSYEIVVTRAVVHRESLADVREDINNNVLSQHDVLSPTYTERSPILVPSRKGYKYLQQHKKKQTECVSERLVERQASREHDLSNAITEVDFEDISPIEVVRRNVIKSTSIGSIRDELGVSKANDTQFIAIDKEMSFLNGTTKSDDMIAEPTRSVAIESKLLDDVLNTAITEPIEWSDGTDNSPIKRLGTDYSITEEPPNKRKKYKTAAIQTNAAVKQLAWEDLRSNFFQGTPLICKLCYCGKHACQ